MNTSKLSTLTISQLKALRDEVDSVLKNKTSEIVNQVRVTKVADSTYRFEFRGNTYEAQKIGARQRYRVWNMVKSLKPGTIKRGKVVSSEFLGDSRHLRSAIAFGSIK